MRDVKSNLIKGKYIADEILTRLANNVQEVKTRYNIQPSLAIILLGDDPASIIYVRNKLKAAEKIGIRAIKIALPESTGADVLLAEIDKLNNNPAISGVIVQLPLPIHIDKEKILLAISPKKDVDGFHPINVGYLYTGMGNGFVPSTALGCIELIKRYEPNIAGKNAVIVGRSNIVGKPVAALLLKEDCTVTICHSKTKNLRSITSGADIIITAIGVPNLLTREFFKKDAIVIDVGMNRGQGNEKITGDVDFQDVYDKVKYITPVPGGVGPMTVAFLLVNTFKACCMQFKLAGYNSG